MILSAAAGCNEIKAILQTTRRHAMVCVDSDTLGVLFALGLFACIVYFILKP